MISGSYFENEFNDLYVDDLAEETGNLWGIWAENHCDMDKMVTDFMCSELRKYQDLRRAVQTTYMYYDMDEFFPDKQSSDVWYTIPTTLALDP